MRVPLRQVVVAGVVAVASLATGKARADLIAPGYVEHCTMEEKGGPGKECLECRAYFGNPGHCSDALASYGFTQACRTRGASTWGEIWCRSASPTAKKVPPEVLGQLNNPRPKEDPVAPVSSTAPTTAPPVSTTGPTAVPASTRAAPANTGVPVTAPQPVPQPQGCACGVGGDGTGPVAASVLAMGAAAVVAVRRRRR